jgi:Spy/CpxP family protein refolding chaperone
MAGAVNPAGKMLVYTFAQDGKMNNKMRNRASSAIVLLTLCASVTFAQHHGPNATRTPAQMVANRVARYTMLLTLTSAQQTQATTIFTTEETTLSPITTSLRAARTALQTAVQKNDLTGINTEATQIGSMTTQQIAAQSTAQAAFFAMLTPDQQTKYTQLQTHGFGGLGPRHGGGH